MVEQPFQERIGEGMIRVYLTHDEVVGFAHQYPRGPAARERRRAAAGEEVRAARTRATTRVCAT